MCASVCLSIVLDKYSRKCISMTHTCFLTTGVMASQSAFRHENICFWSYKRVKNKGLPDMARNSFSIIDSNA